jgi:uncharacterized membrane protein
VDFVKSNISFRGSNLWILACAIVVASIGLNVNSTAVIIGMHITFNGPDGAGFGLGVYDFDLLKDPKNLLIATLVGLLVSTIYFYVSPFKEAQPELSRTSPIYDILIAFLRFGWCDCHNKSRERQSNTWCGDSNSTHASALHRRIWSSIG